MKSRKVFKVGAIYRVGSIVFKVKWCVSPAMCAKTSAVKRQIVDGQQQRQQLLRASGANDCEGYS